MYLEVSTFANHWQRAEGHDNEDGCQGHPSGVGQTPHQAKDPRSRGQEPILDGPGLCRAVAGLTHHGHGRVEEDVSPAAGDQRATWWQLVAVEKAQV